MSERSGDASQMPRVGRQKAARFLSDGSSVRGAAGGGGSSIVGISTAGIGTGSSTPGGKRPVLGSIGALVGVSNSKGATGSAAMPDASSGSSTPVTTQSSASGVHSSGYEGAAAAGSTSFAASGRSSGGAATTVLSRGSRARPTGAGPCAWWSGAWWRSATAAVERTKYAADIASINASCSSTSSSR